MSKSLQLRATPPAVPFNALARTRLALDKFVGAGTNLIDISAPQSFGRTLLLAQWYKESRTADALSIWLSMDGLDDPSRFTQALIMASMKAGTDLIDESFANWANHSNDTMEVLTGWILEIQRSEKNCFLVLDDSDLTSQHLQENELIFLLANAPANLRIAVSTRPGNLIFRQPVFLSSPLIRITAQELRFTVDETFEVVQRTISDQNTADLANQIQHQTEGWPLGVQLALATQVGRGLSSPSNDSVSVALSHYFTANILDNLQDDVIQMLVSLAFLDVIHSDLVSHIAGPNAPLSEFEFLVNTTPLLVRSERSDWLRIHPAALQMMQDRQITWPAKEQERIALTAADWYETRSLFEEAANQARRGGDIEKALDLAEKAIREMTSKGQSTEVIRWVKQLDREELLMRPAFWGPAAWAYANTNDHKMARELVQLIQDHPGSSQVELFEAALIEAAIAGYRDDLTALEEFESDWPAPLDGSPISEQVLHALIIATKHYLMGQPVETRGVLETIANEPEYRLTSPFVRTYVDYYRALTFLWEGKPHLAHECLVPALERVEVEFDLRSTPVTMLSALLAEASVELMKLDEARHLISGRLPLIEKQASSDTIISGYLASSRLAEADKRFDLAEVQLHALISIGDARSLPRVSAAGLSQLVRFHSRHGQYTIAQASLTKLQDLERLSAQTLSPQIQRFVSLQAHLAQSAITEGTSSRDALEAAKQAKSLSVSLKRGRDQILVQALNGHAMLEAGNPQGQLELQEATLTAHAWGLKRLYTDLASIDNMSSKKDEPDTAPATEQNLPRKQTHPSILTPREYDVLCGLAAHLSNKEIALSLGLSDETIKWHLKNIFQKLEASERKIAVARARMLGII